MGSAGGPPEAGREVALRSSEALGIGASLRARERLVQIRRTTGIGILARAMTIAASFVGVPIALAALGDVRYGVWLTISSVVALLTFSNLGVGNSLVNAIGRANARDDREAAARAISSGLVVLGLIAGALVVASIVAYIAVPWDSIFNIRGTGLSDEAGAASLTALLLYSITVPVAIIDAVRLGYQRGYVSHALSILASVITVGALVVVAAIRPTVPFFVLALAGPPLALQLVNWALLLRSRPQLRPRLSLVDRGVASALLKVGAFFLALQLAAAVAFESNSLILAQVLGPTAVTEYAVVSRMFLVPMAIVSLSTGALWPAYREAIVRGDMTWVRSTLRRSILLTFGFTAIASLILLLLHRPLLDLWVGTSFSAHVELVVALAVWTVLWSIGSAISVFLNGAEFLRVQIGLAVAMAVANVVLSILLTLQVGVSGVVWGSVVAYSAVTLAPLALLVPRLLARVAQDHQRSSGSR